MFRPRNQLKPWTFLLLTCLAVLALPVDAAAQTVDERIQRGRQLLGEGQLEEALAELQQAIDESPDSAAALYFAGMALGRLSRFDESFDYPGRLVWLLEARALRSLASSQQEPGRGR